MYSSEKPKPIQMDKIKRKQIAFKLTEQMDHELNILAQTLDVTKATAIRYSISETIKNNLPHE